MRNAPELCRSRKGPLITDKLAQELPLPLSPSAPPPAPVPSPPCILHRHTSPTVKGEMQSAAPRPAINRNRSRGIISRAVHVCPDRARRDTPASECGGCGHCCLVPLVSVTVPPHHPLRLATLPASRPGDRGSDSTALKICT